MRKAAPLPEEIHAALVRLLFTSLPPVILVSFGTIFIGCILAVRSQDVWFFVLTPVAAVISMARVGLLLAHNAIWRRPRPPEKTWEAVYAVLSVTFGMTVGLIGARCLVLDDLPAHVFGVSLVLPYTAGLIGRVSVRPAICLSTIAAIMLPVIAAMALRDVFYGTLAALFSLYLFSLVEMTRHLYRTTVERLLAQREIEHIANYDPLTGIANRAHFRARLDAALAATDGGRVGVLYIDLDRFKAVNDTLGHHAGDALLRIVAARLSEAAAPDGVVGRWGGDEFVLYLRVDKPSVAEALAQRIVDRLSAPCDIEGREILTGTSVGIAIAVKGIDADTLLKQADAALFAAKAKGRGTWCRHEPARRSALSQAA